MLNDLVTLGTSDIQIRPLGIGGWSWGDRVLWGYGRSHIDSDIQAAIKTSLADGVTLIDTAEAYTFGSRSEEILGVNLRELGAQAIIATKFMPYPWRLSRSTLLRALKNSLRRLGLDNVDLYQIHMPFPPLPIEFWAFALVEALESGLTRAVGVSNYNSDQMLKTHEILDSHGYSLSSNQVSYHLLNRKIEQNGLLQACQDAKISLIAYSPLAQGVLTGKYSVDHPLPGIRGMIYGKKLLASVQSLLQLMGKIGQSHGGKTTAQVALNWLICKKTIPIPGAKNAHQAHDNAGALGWRLTEEEVAKLDETSKHLVGE